MSHPDLSDPIFNNENAARKHLESLIWKDGRYCPHCGSTEESRPIRGKKHRDGMYYCNACKKQFTVTVGTLYESSHVALHKWLLATHLLCSSKKGISSHQLHRMIGVTYKTAWFMTHRIREAMRPVDPQPMGGSGQTVEVDETYWGPMPEIFMNPTDGRPGGWRRKSGTKEKMKILTLVERDGQARSFHIPNVKSATLRAVLHRHLKRDTHLMTDEFNAYKSIGLRFITHRTVNHSAKEYVRGASHTNTIENFFSIFKRGLTGTYQHISEKHLKRYLCEFDFRYNERTALKVDDHMRRDKALTGIKGKRMTYQQPRGGKASESALLP